MKWASPWAWILLVPLTLLFLFSFFKKKKERSSLKFSSTLILKQIPGTARSKLLFLPFFLKVVALGLAVVALARPQQANSKVNRNVEGIDIMMAIDVSDSMEIEDMEPTNRIEAAKSVIRNFIKKRTSDRIGLIIFAGESYTRVPLTLDYNVLLESLGNVNTENIKQGTAIGVALANAVARLKESTAKNRILILLTDGESNTGTIDPDTATEIAKGYGIKVYTIGIGRDGEAKMPVYITDPFGRRVKQYQAIHSSVNLDLLQRIANETGGKAFRATDSDALKKVFSTIDQLEKSKIQVNQYVKYTELFSSWLQMALGIFVFQFLISRTILRRIP